MTTGTLLDIGTAAGSICTHTAAETGSLMTLAFADKSDTNNASTTNGLLISPTINTDVAGGFDVARVFNGVKVVPTYTTACQTAAAVTGCTYNSFETEMPAVTQSTTNTLNLNGFNLASAGALLQNTAAGTINATGLNITTANATDNFATSKIINHGLKVAMGTFINTSGLLAKTTVWMW